MLAALRRSIDGSDAQVAPPIPNAAGVTTRRRRTAMTADPTKALERVTNALERVSMNVRKYVDE